MNNNNQGGGQAQVIKIGVKGVRQCDKWKEKTKGRKFYSLNHPLRLSSLSTTTLLLLSLLLAI